MEMEIRLLNVNFVMINYNNDVAGFVEFRLFLIGLTFISGKFESCAIKREDVKI